MTDTNEGLKILASREAAHRISRRRFLAGSAVVMFSSSVLLAACGSETSTPPGSGGQLEDRLNFYNWAEYNDPAIFDDFTAEFGPVTQTDIYESNENMIAKLESAAGTSGYDIVLPTGPFIPLMAEKDLLQELDLAKIPNFKNLDPLFTDQPWDPGNRYSVCKDWGTTGWIYDKTKLPGVTISTWSEFIEAAKGPASGETSLLAAPNELQGLYFWANGIDWNTTDPAHYDVFEKFMVEELAPHIKAYDSYPGIALNQGNFALSQVWNGDARQGILTAPDPSVYVWGLGAPVTELWMDTWAIVKGAEHPEAAHAFINYILDPEVSLTDLAFHGYHSGIADIEASANAAGLELLDMVFFTPEQVATMQAQVVNEMLDRSVEIYNKAQAVSAG